MEEPICCPPQIDTFLAVTPVRSYEPERTRKAVKELVETHQSLEECLDYPMLRELFGDKITIEEKLERVNKYLEYLYKKEELLINNEAKKEEYEKLKREIKHFLEQKKTLALEYQLKLPTILEEALNVPYPEGFWENMRKEIEEQRKGRK